MITRIPFHKISSYDLRFQAIFPSGLEIEGGGTSLAMGLDHLNVVVETQEVKIFSAVPKELSLPGNNWIEELAKVKDDQDEATAVKNCVEEAD